MISTDLTAAINTTLAEFIATGDVSCAYEVGQGLCEAFAMEVLAKLGIDAYHPRREGDPYCWDSSDFWAADFYIDLAMLREMGEPIPDDIPADKLASGLGKATHVWVYFEGKHYDAMNPEGVEHFLELSFFAAQIELWRHSVESGVDKSKKTG